MADAQEITRALDVTLLLGGEGRQAGRAEALLDTLPPWAQSTVFV